LCAKCTSLASLLSTLFANVCSAGDRCEVAAAVSVAAIFGFGQVGLFFRRRSFQKSRTYFTIFLTVIAGALAVAVTACSTTNLSPEAKLSSPAGSYAVTITADEVGSQCISDTVSDSNCTTSCGGQGILVYDSQNQVSRPFYVNVTVKYRRRCRVQAIL